MDEKLNPNAGPAQDAAAHDTAVPHAVVEVARAAAAADPADLREQVRRLTARALDDRTLSLGELRATLRAIFSGVGAGLDARGDALRTGLAEAALGMRQALGDAAATTRASARHSFEAGRAHGASQWQATRAQLQDIEAELRNALRGAAHDTRGVLGDEFRQLADALRAQRAHTRERLDASVARVKATVREDGGRLACAVRSSAALGRTRLAHATSGLLAAVSESLKRQSERLGR